MTKKTKKLDVTELPALEDWPAFLMVVEQGGSVWIGVGPDTATHIRNYHGWKYLAAAAIGNSRLGVTQSQVPGTPGRCGGRWWDVSSQVDLRATIEEVRRLIASDAREFFYVKDGVTLVGNLPEMHAAESAALIAVGSQQALIFPVDAPGAREFAAAGLFTPPLTVSGLLIYLHNHDQVLARLPAVLHPGPPTRLSTPRASVSGTGWLCAVRLMLPTDDHDQLTAESGMILAVVSKGAPASLNKKGIAQFPASEWPQWSAWMQDQGISWTAEPGCDPEAPWNRPVDEDKLASLPGWSAPAQNGLWLHEFQKTGVRFAITRGMRALMGDDMGLGKTVQSIMVALYSRAQRVVVVAPASVRGVWEGELLSWGAATRDQIQLLRDGLDYPRENTKWLICSYDQITTRNLPWNSLSGAEHEALTGLLRKLGVSFFDKHDEDGRPKNTIAFPDDEALDKDVTAAIREILPKKRQDVWDRFVDRRAGMILRVLGDWGPDLVIFDEGHRLKNSDAKRAVAGIHLSGTSGGCLLLSGTPIQNRTAEPAALLHVLDPIAYREVKAGEKITIERIKGLLKPSMIRRVKGEVLTQLPPVVEQVIPLAGDGFGLIGNRNPDDVVDPQTGMTIMGALEEAGHAVLDARDRAHPDTIADRGEYSVLRAAWSTGPTKPTDDSSHQPLPPLSLFEMARTRLGLAKARAAQTADLVEDILESRGCLVVFTAHHAAADHLAGHLGSRWKTVVMDGRTPPNKRAEIVDTFQSGGIDCLIAGMDAAGEGITLHRADTCLFLETATKPSTMRQARDRLHRIGQKATVQAIYLVADNPIDRFFRDLCLDKAALVGDVLEETVQVLGESRGAGKEAAPKSGHGYEITTATSAGATTTQRKKNTPKKKREPEVAEPGEEQATDGIRKRRATQGESQHPEKVKRQTAARVKQYRERHPDKHRESMRAYRQAHKTESSAYMREYRKGNEDLKAKHREYMRAWRASQKVTP